MWCGFKVRILCPGRRLLGNIRRGFGEPHKELLQDHKFYLCDADPLIPVKTQSLQGQSLSLVRFEFEALESISLTGRLDNGSNRTIEYDLQFTSPLVTFVEGDENAHDVLGLLKAESNLTVFVVEKVLFARPPRS